MIESVALPSIHANVSIQTQYNKNSGSSISCRLKFPFQIKPVDSATNERLLKDFTGNLLYFFVNK